MIRRVCCVCGVELGSPLETNKPGETLSHGFCRHCLEQYMAGTGESFDDYLDTIEVPILVANSNGSVLFANTQARELVSKDLDQISGRLGGEVFDCEYASLPGGCGHTIHCQSCTVRNTIMKTFETGEPCTRVKACLDLDTIIGPRVARFLISSEKTGETVTLIIEEINTPDQTDCSPGS